ncbi:hypothetical protein B4102_1204 [Heyndrickxia sporothermodurans]|uniref:Uncharacterized protein n=1 Tax=Heyndrickxia sporothermodurans TaxID=46224 RepID=A0A150KPB3_9BACI|nr:hypothetical protein B4102_1204 [Heyndrickxia sporothermodurans]
MSVHYKNKDYTGPTSIQYWESTVEKIIRKLIYKEEGKGQ